MIWREISIGALAERRQIFFICIGLLLWAAAGFALGAWVYW